MGLHDLPHVHPRGNAERVEDDIDGRSVCEIRHVLFRHRPGDYPFVPVTAGHLVPDRKLAFHRDVHLHHLEYARGKLVPFAHPTDPLLEDRPDQAHLILGHLVDIAQTFPDRRILLHFDPGP